MKFFVKITPMHFLSVSTINNLKLLSIHNFLLFYYKDLIRTC